MALLLQEYYRKRHILLLRNTLHSREHRGQLQRPPSHPPIGGYLSSIFLLKPLGRMGRIHHIHQLAIIFLALNLGGVNSHRHHSSDNHHQHNNFLTMPDGGPHQEVTIQEGVVIQLTLGAEAEVAFMDNRIELDLNHRHKHTIAWALLAKEIHVCFVFALVLPTKFLNFL
jgi:hypothetical protein